MKKKVITLSCIAAVAIATFVGAKTFESNAYENGLLTQNVEALSKSEAREAQCYNWYHYQQGYQIRACSTCKYINGTFDFWFENSKCKY